VTDHRLFGLAVLDRRNNMVEDAYQYWEGVFQTDPGASWILRHSRWKRRAMILHQDERRSAVIALVTRKNILEWPYGWMDLTEDMVGDFHIYFAYTLRSRRCQGIMTKLVEEVKAKYSDLSLESTPEHAPFWKRRGFTKIEPELEQLNLPYEYESYRCTTNGF
jgi:ribosomal protein S18 acetylase RimI-like enzyme